jgi:hypothetical protein
MHFCLSRAYAITNSKLIRRLLWSEMPCRFLLNVGSDLLGYMHHTQEGINFHSYCQENFRHKINYLENHWLHWYIKYPRANRVSSKLMFDNKRVKDNYFYIQSNVTWWRTTAASWHFWHIVCRPFNKKILSRPFHLQYFHFPYNYM